jgi:hypothetical protein
MRDCVKRADRHPPTKTNRAVTINITAPINAILADLCTAVSGCGTLPES